MKRNFPDFTYFRKPGKFNHIVFSGELQPDETMPVFKVEIHYEPRHTPRAFQISPELTTKKHRYDDGSLCLYKVSERQWKEGDSIAELIVPLTALWLYYNEYFKVSGDWLAKEASHELGTTKSNK